MKKITRTLALILFACAIATTYSCKKTSTNPTVQSWTLDTTTYLPTTVARFSNNFYATDSIGLITFVFAAIPSSSGVYKIGDPKAASDAVNIEARNGTDFSSYSGFVTVTVSGGKISVDAKDIWMREVPMFTDSVKLSAHLTEQ